MTPGQAQSGGEAFGEVREPLARLAEGGGSDEDLRKLVAALAREWAIPLTDPRAIEHWLGVPRSDPRSLPLMSARRTDFENYQRYKLSETRRLVEGMVRGPHIALFFESIRGFSAELKQLCYRTAASKAEGTPLVKVLVALSLEPIELIERAIANGTRRLELALFRKYLEARTSLVLHDEDRAVIQKCESPTELEALLRLSVDSPERQQVAIRATDHDRLDAFAKLARNLLSAIPDQGFGRFIRFNLSVFLGLTGLAGSVSGEVNRTLLASGNYEAAEVIATWDFTELQNALHFALSSERLRESRLAVGLIDAARTRHPDRLALLQPMLAPYQRSDSPLLSVAADAVLLQSGQTTESEFGKRLLQRLRKDKRGAVAAWVAKNDAFIAMLAVDQAPPLLQKLLVDTLCSSRPETAVRMIRKTLWESRIGQKRSVQQEMLRALCRVGSASAEQALLEFLRGNVAGADCLLAGALTKAVNPSFVKRVLWRLILEQPPEQCPEELVRALGKVFHPSDFSDFADVSAEGSRHRMAQVAATLLEAEVLPVALSNVVKDPQLLEQLTRELCGRLSRDFDYLRTVPAEWVNRRDNLKAELAESIGVGIRIGLLTCTHRQLRTDIGRLSGVLEAWRNSNSPAVDPAVYSISQLEPPAIFPADAALAAELFRAPVQTPHDLPLLAAANPWLLDLVFGTGNAAYPKPELLVEAIAKSFVFVATLSKRARDDFDHLAHAVKIDVAVAIRDQLKEIEESLAGYFALRSVLSGVGLQPIFDGLGTEVAESQFSSEKHKILREPGRRGRWRAFSLGMQVEGTAVGSATIMKSGEADDRD